MISVKFIWQMLGEIHQMIFTSQIKKKKKKKPWEANLQILKQHFKNWQNNLLYGPKQDVN